MEGGLEPLTLWLTATRYNQLSFNHSCQYHMICDTYCIIYIKFHIIRAYLKYSWIIWYTVTYCMNRIVSVNRTYRTIHRHIGLKWVFLLKFVVLFDLNKLLDIFNTKLLGNLIESNSHEFFFFPPFSFSYKI